tara:strand:- start:625 stop:771 length:147 start_codon:yes stop_codon:yes gene_type:complete
MAFGHQLVQFAPMNPGGKPLKPGLEKFSAGLWIAMMPIKNYVCASKYQ